MTLADRSYCEAELEQMAAAEPEKLLALIRSEELPAHLLTFAAEYAGRIEDSKAALAALLPLLWGGNALVREGAIYGIAQHMDADVAHLLRDRSDRDSSPAVRSVCAAIADEWCLFHGRHTQGGR